MDIAFFSKFQPYLRDAGFLGYIRTVSVLINYTIIQYPEQSTSLKPDNFIQRKSVYNRIMNSDQTKVGFKGF